MAEADDHTAAPPVRPGSETAFWREVEAAFSAVLEAGAATRTAVLAARCGADPALQAEVEALLAAHGRAGQFLAPPSAAVLARAAAADAEADASAPSRVGAFRLLERIGEGGMGTVYRAERVQGDFSQEVAVKLITARLCGADTLRRFRAERQILASLQHPNIVALLDGGLTAAGHPYIAMEYVRGLPLTESCRELPLEERLRLFRQLCAAVGFAHRRLVVHRDLKPANVLVTAEGTVKVLDFGVAKLLAGEASAAETTGILLGPLTPDYASPEQLTGAPVTTACDVYSLGVMLYELVTGRRPYATAGKTLDELLSLLLHQEPQRPSGATGGDLPYDLRRLRGDLDTVVLVAMAKHPERRYASADELSEELQRFLDGRPVVARGPSLRYLAGKVVARHKAAFAAAGVLLTLLLVALGLALWQARVAARERERARQRYADVRRLTNSMIFKIHDSIEPLAGSTPARRLVIAEGLTFLDALQQDAAGDPTLRLELAQGYMKIGRVLGSSGASNLGDRAGALEAQRRARDLLRPLLSSPGTGAAAAAAWIDANLQIAYAARGEERRGAIEEALRAAQEWHARAPHDALAQERLAKAHFCVAIHAGHADALPHWREARRLFAAALSSAPNDDDRLRNASLTERRLSHSLAAAGDHEGALRHRQRAYGLDLRRVGAAPDNAEARLELALDIGSLADSEVARGNLAAGIARYKEALALHELLSAADPQNVFARAKLAHAHSLLAQSYRSAGRPAPARGHVRRALALYDGLAGFGVERALALVTLGDLEAAVHRRAAACRAYREAQHAFADDDALEQQKFTSIDEERESIARRVEACR